MEAAYVRYFVRSHPPALVLMRRPLMDLPGGLARLVARWTVHLR